MKLIALKKDSGFTVPYMFLDIETAKKQIKEAIETVYKEATDEQKAAMKETSKRWELWLVGEYDTETGEIESFPTPISLFNEVVHGIV